MSQHHPSCKPSDRELVWLCNRCGGHEPASELEERLEQMTTNDKSVPTLGEVIAEDLSKNIAHLPAEVKQQFASLIDNHPRLQQLQKDKESLDGLQSLRADVEQDPIAQEWKIVTTKGVFRGPTLRRAIDAAMAPADKTEENRE